MYRDALRGDCHLHSTWSDGGAPIEAMAATAMAIGHEYMVQTDHSARLTIAHGLNEERLAEQLDQIAEVNAGDRRRRPRLPDPVRDGGRHPRWTARSTSSDEMLERLDVVVASVHSKLRMERKQMTERMLMAVASPHVDILGHCTGRMIGKRPPSDFDADYVFAACAQFNTAVEINCRPERLDPPRELIDVAIEYGCWFSIDTDAHATGQLEWQPLGCDRAAERERADRPHHQHAVGRRPARLDRSAPDGAQRLRRCSDFVDRRALGLCARLARSHRIADDRSRARRRRRGRQWTP